MRPIIALLFLTSIGCSTSSVADIEALKPLAIATLAAHKHSHTPVGPVAPTTHDRGACPTGGWITHGDGHKSRCPDCRPSWEADSPFIDLDAIKCECGDNCHCEKCDGQCDWPFRSSGSKAAVAVASAGDFGRKTYADALAHVAATGEAVDVVFVDAETRAPRSGYVCDISKQSDAVRYYWIDANDGLPITKRMVLIDGKVRREDWPEEKRTRSVVTRRAVAKQPGPTWTWPGDLRQHLQSEKHGHSAAELEGMSDAELRALHDNDHNAIHSSRAVWTPIYTPSSGNCPGGNCPSPSSYQGRFFRRR